MWGGWSIAFLSPIKKNQIIHRHGNTKGEEENKLYSSLNTHTKINFGCQRTLCKILLKYEINRRK